MTKIDLRTYVLLERSFARRLQRSWQQKSAPVYAAIAQACNDHKWDEARRLVQDLDMTEVGTENREWITYMLLSCAVFGANVIAKKKPSFVGVGTFDTFLKQTTNNMLQYLEYSGTARVQAEALQSIAEDEAKTKALKREYVREPAGTPEGGQFAKTGGVKEFEDLAEGGGGPERKKWLVLNQAAAEAEDAAYEAEKAHRAVYERMGEKVKGPRSFTTAELIAREKIWNQDPEYVASKEKYEAAERAMVDADRALKEQYPAMKQEVVTKLALSTANELGVHPWHVNVVSNEPREFKVGDKLFKEGGHYESGNEQIVVNSRDMPYANIPAVKGVVAHELSHFMYDRLKKVADQEFDRYTAKAFQSNGFDRSDWFLERFEPDPKSHYSWRLKEAYRGEMAKEFPASAVLSNLAGGKIFTGISNEVVSENGHSEYSKSYWSKEAIAKTGYESAINETTAELTRYISYPKSWNELTTPQDTSSFMQFTKAMHQWYTEQQAKANP